MAFSAFFIEYSSIAQENILGGSLAKCCRNQKNWNFPCFSLKIGGNFEASLPGGSLAKLEVRLLFIEIWAIFRRKILGGILAKRCRDHEKTLGFCLFFH